MTNKSSMSWKQQLNTARARFADGEPLPATLLPDAIARSWQRSRDAGMLPWQAPQYEFLSVTAREQESPQNRRLYSCVVDEIEQLWAAFGGADWVIFCTNLQGTVVHVRKSPACNDKALLPLVPGRRALESYIGTTAPSCTIHDGGQVIVAGGQHYLREFERFFCLAVPLYGLHGEVIGALDLTGIGQRNVAQVGEQLRLAAMTVEQRLFATLRGCHLLRVQHDPRWLGTPLAGLLAVEDDGRVRAASRTARGMLGLPAGALPPMLDLPRLFADAAPAQQRRLLCPTGSAKYIACADGSHLWLQYARAPLGRSTARQWRAETVSGFDELASPIDKTIGDASLQEQSLQAIQHAMREHEGNVAAVARQLGISRTTVYAKLRQLRQAGLLRDGDVRH